MFVIPININSIVRTKIIYKFNLMRFSFSIAHRERYCCLLCYFYPINGMFIWKCLALTKCTNKIITFHAFVFGTCSSMIWGIIGAMIKGKNKIKFILQRHTAWNMPKYGELGLLIPRLNRLKHFFDGCGDIFMF